MKPSITKPVSKAALMPQVSVRRKPITHNQIESTLHRFAELFSNMEEDPEQRKKKDFVMTHVKTEFGEDLVFDHPDIVIILSVMLK